LQAVERPSTSRPAPTQSASGPSAVGPKNGSFDLLAPMQIVGEGPSASLVDGSSVDSAFQVSAPQVALKGLAVRHGAEAGAIVNTGQLTLENVAVVDAPRGILNQGSLSVRHGILEGDGQGIAGPPGGAILNDAGATAVITDSLISENSGFHGAGAYNAGDLTIERTSLIGNAGGGTGCGGGVWSGGAGTLTLVDDTLVGNHCNLSSHGGGLYVEAGSAQLVNVTITSNASDLDGGGIFANSGATIFLKNSIVSGNSSLSPSAMPSECGGAILSGDYDLIGARATCVLTGVVDHVNATDVDPGLDPLGANGGFAPDQRSTTFGPTVEVIPPASCTDPFGAPLTVDGRGYRRSGSCDIGADQRAGRYAPSPLLGVELLRNGGAAGDELGLASDGSSADPPYWMQPSGGMTQVLYGSPGGFPSRSDAPEGSGSYFFAGDANAPTFTSSSQQIDVSPVSAQIDAGLIGFATSGAFGGFGSYDDYATLTVAFEDAFLSPLLTVGIGGFNAADRGNATKLLPDSRSGTVPAGTRLIEVALTATRLQTDTTYNNGYADDLSLKLPEPAHGSLAAAAVGALAALRRRTGTVAPAVDGAPREEH